LVQENAENKEADISASRKRRKVSSWSRGNANSRRTKKGKADADHSNTSVNGNTSANGNVTVDNSANENSCNNGHENGSAIGDGATADADFSSVKMEETDETAGLTEIMTLEPEQVIEVSTVVDDSILDESHYSEPADATDNAVPTGSEMATSSTLCNLPTKVVKVDTDRLEQLLDLVVARTADFSLERLLRLYSKLNRLIVRFSRMWDRTALIQVLEYCKSLLVCVM
jgi:hypothetical protein